jgi:archaeosortase A (PGF-CTERM-specific)
MLLIGYLFFPFPPSDIGLNLSYIPLFLGLILLGIGFFWKTKPRKRSMMKMLGWGVFAFFWALQPNQLYRPSGDVFNGAVCIIGVYVLFYLGYHEWLSWKRNEENSALQWIAGGTFLAGIIYFTIDTGVFPGLKTWMITSVAEQTRIVLHVFGIPATGEGVLINYQNAPITIIFACTAIQSMVLFVGMIGALHKASLKRKLVGLGVTVIPIYFLNLLRNAGVVYMVGSNLTSFDIAHNVIAKAGSLVALIILLLITFKIVPELYDEIMGVIDLPKRNGPVELFLKRLVGKKTNDAR